MKRQLPALLQQSNAMILAGLLLACAFIISCAPPEPPGVPEPISEDDFIVLDTDFFCINDMPRVGRYSVLNLNGMQLEAELVAEQRNLGTETPPNGQFPIGTIIQVIPSEAMVKRAPGYDPQNNDWEYMSLRVSNSGTEIRARGKGEVSNIAGSCLGCHASAAAFDFICIDQPDLCPLDFTLDRIDGVREEDPRCN